MGQTLAVVACPDVVRAHVPTVCGQCQQPLGGVPGMVVERRHVPDLPPLRLEVTEHHALAVACPACQAVTRGVFPDAVRAPTQYGPRVRAVTVSFHHAQIMPQERTHAALATLFGCTVSDGTVAHWVEQAGQTLAPTVAQIADLVAASSHQHVDETGIRSGGKRHWLHVNSTRWLIHLARHPTRGAAATAAMGIWPRFHGRATHDRWASYDAYLDGTHSLCGAHRLRELALVADQDGQAWARALADVLRGMGAAATARRRQGVTAVPTPCVRGKHIARWKEHAKVELGIPLICYRILRELEDFYSLFAVCPIMITMTMTMTMPCLADCRFKTAHVASSRSYQGQAMMIMRKYPKR